MEPTDEMIEAEARYPIPAPVNPASADDAMRVVFIQGQRQGWIDARRAALSAAPAEGRRLAATNALKGERE